MHIASLVYTGSFFLKSITNSFNEVAPWFGFIAEKSNGLKLVLEVFRKLNAKLIQIAGESWLRYQIFYRQVKSIVMYYMYHMHNVILKHAQHDAPGWNFLEIRGTHKSTDQLHN